MKDSDCHCRLRWISHVACHWLRGHHAITLHHWDATSLIRDRWRKHLRLITPEPELHHRHNGWGLFVIRLRLPGDTECGRYYITVRRDEDQPNCARVYPPSQGVLSDLFYLLVPLMAPEKIAMIISLTFYVIVWGQFILKSFIM